MSARVLSWTDGKTLPLPSTSRGTLVVFSKLWKSWCLYLQIEDRDDSQPRQACGLKEMLCLTTLFLDRT